MNEKSKHSRLPPSSASRRVMCPGSRAMEEPYRNKESQYSREGEAAHWLAALYLLYPGQNGHLTIAPNDEPITDEMCAGAKLYSEYIQQFSNYKLFFVEESIQIHDIHPECWGTPDCWVYDPFTKILRIFDYKFGHGYVEVFENWQLIEYASGILALIKEAEPIDEPILIFFHIIQPRWYGQEGKIREWFTTSEKLEPYFKQLRDVEHEAMKEITFCNVSTECKYCLARAVCPTLQKNVAGLTDVSLSNIPYELSSIECGNELKYLQLAEELINARRIALEEQATFLIKSGKIVPNFTLEPSAGKRVWCVSSTEVATLGELFNTNVLKVTEAMTPIQAIKAGLPEKIVEMYSEIKGRILKLVPTKTKKIFKGCNNEKN